ncbi:hypothetical protein POM88_014193 [Heracleum sosnowskyi]|uniref:HAT C-terminal dimerisation domain-containing protein n=1 Tax=Heracleum sosnowskyi TaxID=360622 RepID=A0AAD8IZY3_9APIA|nr:hypothetical protein POM88_014193 [Heracleum sosnowskyi]
MQLYESLSEDEGDMHDEDQEEPSNPTDPTMASFVKPGTGNKRKGTRQKRSKAWNTFDELPIGEDKVVNVRFSKSLVETLKQIFNVYKSRIPTYSVVREPEPRTSLQMDGSDVMKEFDVLDMELNPTLEKTELDRYLEEKMLNMITDIDILEYWNSNQFRFPNLVLMARDILSIPIESVCPKSNHV